MLLEKIGLTELLAKQIISLQERYRYNIAINNKLKPAIFWFKPYSRLWLLCVAEHNGMTEDDFNELFCLEKNQERPFNEWFGEDYENTNEETKISESVSQLIDWQ